MKITLEQVTGYEITALVDEIRTESKGYWKDPNLAAIKCKGAGWYGDNGNLQEVNLYLDEGGNLFKLIPIERGFQDDYEEVIAKIKAKLTREEWNLMGIDITNI